MKNKITPWVQSIGILLPLMGSGFIFFIRSFVPLGNPSIFTLLFQLVSLVLLIPTSSFKTLYKGNSVLFTLFTICILYAYTFFFIYNREAGGRYIDITYFTIAIIYLLFLHKIDYSITPYLLKVILILTLITNISLVYYIVFNPQYVVGMRATVSFNSNNSSEFSGNPHIYARNALTSMIVSLIFLFKQKNSNYLSLLFYWICFLLGLSVLFLSMVRTYLIIAPLIFIFLFISNQAHANLKSKFNPNKTYLSLLGLIAILFITAYDKISNLIAVYAGMGFDFVNKALSTIWGGTGGDTAAVDESANTRINSLIYVKNYFTDNPHYFIFGNGFKYKYLDVPYVELFLNFGIIGILFFTLYFIHTYYLSLKNIFLSTDPFQLFVSIYVLSTVLSLFTHGRPLDYAFYIHAAFYIRFLATDHLKTIE